MRKSCVLVSLAVLALSETASAAEGGLDEFMGYYAQREEGVTIGAGDAKEANSAIHAIDPWPPSAANRAIPASGERMSGAIRRYQDVSKLHEAAPALAPDTITAKGVGSNSPGR